MRQASFHREEGASIVAAVRRGEALGVGEGCPRPYQTGEDVDSGIAWLASVGEEALDAAADLQGLRSFVEARRAEIDRHPAAFCALELALVDALAREAGQCVESLLGLPEEPRSFAYAVALSDDPLDVTRAILDRTFGAGIFAYKVKLGPDLGRNCDRLRLLWERAPGPLRVRLDANNLWGEDTEAAVRALRQLDRPFDAVEEPLSPRRPLHLARVAREVGTSIVLDESLCTLDDLALYEDTGVTWIANLKVSRCGGLLRAIELGEAVRARGWPIVIGAQIGESSLLTRAGIALARALMKSVVGMEGGAGELLLVRDPARPVLQLGDGGRIDPRSSGCGPHGLGLSAEWASAASTEI